MTLIGTAALVIVATIGIAVQGQPEFGAPRMFLPPAPISTLPPSNQRLRGTPSPEHAQRELRIDLSWLLLALIVLAIVIVLALIVRRLRRAALAAPPPLTALTDLPPSAPVPAPDRAPEPARVLRGLDLASAELAAHRDPRTAVERAWVGLEQGAAESGVRRLAAETPSEFTARVVARVAPDEGAARSLLGVYLRARFSAEPITADDIATATAAVDALRASWSTKATGRSSR